MALRRHKEDATENLVEKQKTPKKLAKKAKSACGQATVELAFILPVFLIVAVIAINLGLFLSECASFDRAVNNAVRVWATSPTYEESSDAVALKIRTELENNFSHSFESVELAYEAHSFNKVTYTATLSFSPHIFNMALSPTVFGVTLPSASHKTSFTVMPYKPGIVM